MDTGFCLWFTGRSGSGKSAIADALTAHLTGLGLPVEHVEEEKLAADILQESRAGETEQHALVKTALTMARSLLNHGIIPIVTLRTPMESWRREIKQQLPAAIMLYTKCKKEVCAERDPHNLYHQGKDAPVPGVDGVFEEPQQADLVLNTYIDDKDHCAQAVIRHLELNGYLEISSEPTKEPPADGYQSDEEKEIKKRLLDLGYL